MQVFELFSVWESLKLNSAFCLHILHKITWRPYHFVLCKNGLSYFGSSGQNVQIVPRLLSDSARLLKRLLEIKVFNQVMNW